MEFLLTDRQGACAIAGLTPPRVPWRPAHHSACAFDYVISGMTLPPLTWYLTRYVTRKPLAGKEQEGAAAFLGFAQAAHRDARAQMLQRFRWCDRRDRRVDHARTRHWPDAFGGQFRASARVDDTKPLVDA